MKRTLAFILSVVMLLAAMMPAQVFAQNDSSLENAIKSVKAKFQISDKLTEFNYSVSTEGSRKIWYLNWHSKDGMEGSVGVRISESGRILNYDFYKPYENNNQRKLPKLSRYDARLIAEDFIKKVEPELAPKLSLRENNYNSLMETEYSFNYVRIENDVPFYANNVSVRVNRNTGDVCGYYCNWTDGIVFPSPEKVISLDEAQKAYKDKLGLELTYNHVFENEKIKPFAVYTSKYDMNWYIDALSGEKVNLSPMLGFPHSYDAKGEKLSLSKAAGMGGDINLSPDELKAVEKASKLKTKEEAEKVARDLKILELTDEYQLAHSSLSRDWPNNDEFAWFLTFSKGEKARDEAFRNVSVRINALTGEIKSFYKSAPYKEGEEAKFDEKASKEAVEAFLKEIQPSKFAESFYDDKFNKDYFILKNGNKPREYGFKYTRRVNGVPFPGNSLIVRFDAVNGKVSSYEMNWFNVEFPPVDKAVSLETIYSNMFKEIGLELQYVAKFENSSSKIMPREIGQPSEVKLAYAVKPGKPLTFDANSGVILDYNGQPYKEVKAAEFSDIAGHFAENQIKILAEFGISLEGKEFKPDASIMQKDFLKLLSKTIQDYGYVPYLVKESDKEIEEMYKSLIRGGVVKESEKAPEAVVTREEAVKFIIRALKYDKVADIKGIFNCTFKDIDSINPDLIGYVTIAQGLGIINGYEGNFNPKGELTRAQAIIVIYNYLQR